MDSGPESKGWDSFSLGMLEGHLFYREHLSWNSWMMGRTSQRKKSRLKSFQAEETANAALGWVWRSGKWKKRLRCLPGCAGLKGMSLYFILMKGGFSGREVMPWDGPDGSAWTSSCNGRGKVRAGRQWELLARITATCSEMSDMGHFGCRSNRTDIWIGSGVLRTWEVFTVYIPLETSIYLEGLSPFYLQRT